MLARICASIVLPALVAVGLCGCREGDRTGHYIDVALELAGDNRGELERVLDHYAGDSLRLEAARFLIANMPGHYSYADSNLISAFYSKVDTFVSRYPHLPFQQMSDSVAYIYNLMHIDRCKKIDDCKIISSAFLIENIDRAFEQWLTNPWLEHLTFEQFCEYILPYKNGELQPLNDWRDRFADVYADELDDLQYCDMYSRSTFQAAKVLNNALKRDIKPLIYIENNFPVYDVATRIKIPYGRCDDFVFMTNCIFRSKGLPVVRDHTPHWANQRLGHSWNALLAQTGKTVPFTGITSLIGEPQLINERLAKVFRNTYARNTELVKLNNSGEYVPAFLRNIFQRDVTDEYIATVEAPVKCPRGIHNRYAWLCVFGDNDWTPVDFTEIDDNMACFKNIGSGVVYLPVVYDVTGRLTPLSDPFIMHADNTVEFIRPDVTRNVSASLTRKYIAKPYTYDYAKLVKGGVFEGANTPDFSGRIYTVGPIETGYAISGEFNVSDSVPPCRYWRYINRNDETYCSMADLFFYGPDSDTPESGTIIGTEGSWEDNPEWVRENLFDGNALTSYCAPRHTGCWVGLDMGHPVKISRIRYTPRADGNMVEPGDEYELTYWDGGRWASLGRKRAETVSIDYDNIPAGALLLLRNRTKGREERIFTLDPDGSQHWH